jgi:hypothetical protein
MQQFSQRCEDLCNLIESRDEPPSLSEILFMLSLKGKPYTLENHFLMEPMFSLHTPPRMIAKTCRQVGKTNNAAGAELLLSNIIPHHSTLIITPRFEQVKRISSQYIRPLVNDSPIRSLLIDKSCEQSVLQRSFTSRSVMYFSFAFLDAERVRGIPADRLWIDEIQDMNWEFIPLIEQTISGSPTGVSIRFTGTPKGMANTEQKLWEKSSQAEWLIKCEACNKWNISCIEDDLLKMIGPTTVICAKCSKRLDPRLGLYVHRFPELRGEFPGIHISQPITPLYYDNRQNPDEPTRHWLEFLDHQRNYPTAKFMNECLGESYDDEERLITQRDIRNISIPDRKNDLREAILNKQNYNRTAIGIDWGGGGDATQSHTVLVFGGLQPGRQGIDILYAIRFRAKLGPLETLRAVIEHIKLLTPTFIAHDYTGAGYNWHAALIREGIPKEKVIPFSYCSSEHRNVIYYRKADKGSRACYQIDKPRSINILTLTIKAKQITFPEFGMFQHLSEDLLNLYTERTERPRGSDVWLISKTAGRSDDFVHALNFVCSGLWWTIQKYPSLEEAFDMRYTIDDLTQMGGHRQELTMEDWEQKTDGDQ